VILESVRVAFTALLANRLRAVLTMLGIIIGVGAVITLMSAGAGVQRYVDEQFRGIGANLLFVAPGNVAQNRSGPPDVDAAAAGAALTTGDALAIADSVRAPDVLLAAPELMRFGKVSAAGRDTTTAVRGVTSVYSIVRAWPAALGTFITDSDVLGQTRVAVLGQTVVIKLFPNGEYPIGQAVKINGLPFRVVGVAGKKGGTGFGDQDDVVFVPLPTAQTHLFVDKTASGERRLSVIYVQAVTQDRMGVATDQIAAILRERHKISFRDEDDFSVINQADVIKVFGEITGVLTVFLGAIAGISLLVGGIGIMNIMLVSVTERTREIGIRKAVGAKRRDILSQFIVEAMTLSLLGGVLGIALGSAGAVVIAQLAAGFYPVISADAMLLATGVSAAVGLFFGLYPAWRAARLNPIEALRYE
jgi:putative ABC transport system permease protein